MKRIIAIVLPLALVTGCLKNLNQAEFFRKLRIKSPELYELVTRHRNSIEKRILKVCKEKYGQEISKITYWGEGRYWAGHVVKKQGNKKYVIQSGIVRLSGVVKKKHRYTLLFDVARSGDINVIQFWK